MENVHVSLLGLVCFGLSPAQAIATQGIFGAGMGTLVNITLMAFIGMSALESSIVKRYSQVVLNVLIVVGVLASHLIVWQIIGIFAFL